MGCDSKSIRTVCIIPCFNEFQRIPKVLANLRRVRFLDAILVVDDGSTDDSPRIVLSAMESYTSTPRDYPTLHFICSAANRGKAAAILQGTLWADDLFPPPEYILLVDADLKGLNPNEFERALSAIRSDPSIDMLVLRRIYKDPITRWLGGDLLITGERIVRRIDLLQLLKHHPVSGYQLEVALNQYMLENQKNIRWLPVSSIGVNSLIKIGWIPGLQKEFSMFYQLYRYLGFRKILAQRRVFKQLQGL